MTIQGVIETIAKHYVSEWDGDEEDVYANMKEDLAALVHAARRIALEECAVLAGAQSTIARTLGNSGEQWAYEDIAQRIRGLK